ncbi:hypothetical protein GCM10027058_05210 [Microbacterium neimengense]
MFWCGRRKTDRTLVAARGHNGSVYTELALPDGSALWRSTGGAGGAVPADGCVDLILLAGRAAVENPWSRTVQTRAGRGIPAGRVAAEMNESERTFRRRMRERFGYGYAILVRIERARRAQELLRTGLPLADVAAAAGFADQPHFSREFRRLVGASPAQFASSAA